jgi:hypothetical protein
MGRKRQRWASEVTQLHHHAYIDKKGEKGEFAAGARQHLHHLKSSHSALISCALFFIGNSELKANFSQNQGASDHW